MSWAVIRRRLPALRTLPSRIVATSRSLPISRTCRSFPLCAKEDVLAATRSPSSRVNALINSSAMPSPKYSWSPSGLMSVKGSTAMEGGACSSPFGPLASAATGCSSGSMGANGSRDTKSSSDLEDPAVVTVCEEDPVRTTPPGVTSNAQASTRATGKPSRMSATTNVTVQAGRLSAGRKMSAASPTPNPTIR